MTDHDSRGPVKIGNDVWMGTGACISSGVTVGDGAVIAAHAVPTKDAAPYAIVGGNPTRLLRNRFPNAIIERLLDIAWWNWCDDKVNDMLPLMLGGDIHAFLSAGEQDGQAGTN